MFQNFGFDYCDYHVLYVTVCLCVSGALSVCGENNINSFSHF